LSGATILDVTYGYEVRSLPDEMIDLAVRVVDDATFNASPGTRPVDIFPWGENFAMQAASSLLYMDLIPSFTIQSPTSHHGFPDLVSREKPWNYMLG
jgi:hypothetical protein